MSRKPNARLGPAPEPVWNEAAAERLDEAAHVLPLVQDARHEGIQFGQFIGRMQAGQFIASASQSVVLAAYEEAKKSGVWRTLERPGPAGGKFESFDAFCQTVFGLSYRRLQDVLANRSLLGAELFEQAERLGLRQVDYNAMKALPAPEQELVRRAVEEADSREAVVELLEELATRNVKAREAKEEELESVRRDHAATEKRLEVVSRQKEAAEERAARIAVEPPDEALAGLRAEATALFNDALGLVRGRLRAALQALYTAGEDRDVNTLFSAGLVGQIVGELARLREMYGLPDVSNAVDQEILADLQKWAPQGGERT